MTPATNWPDRRLIGAVYWSANAWKDQQRLPDGTYRTKPGSNPRGWNPWFHGDLDATAPDYVPKFRAVAAPFITESLDRLAAMKDTAGNCIVQGAYEHDPEGSEFAQPVTYEGNILFSSPPEMSIDFIKWRVAEAAKRGLWWGCTIRHTLPVWVEKYDDSLGMNARERWGGRWRLNPNSRGNTLTWQLQTLRHVFGDNFRFVYYDTNVQDAADGDLHTAWDKGVPWPIPAVEITLAALTVPDPRILVSTEFGCPIPPNAIDGYPLTPFQKANWGDPRYLSTPNVAPWQYPSQASNASAKAAFKRGGFTLAIPDITSAGDDPAYQKRVTDDMKLGCVMACTATWDASWNTWIRKCYLDAHPVKAAQPAMQLAALAAQRRQMDRPNPNEFTGRPLRRVSE